MIFVESLFKKFLFWFFWVWNANALIGYFVVVFYSLIVEQYFVIFCPKLFQLLDCSWRWRLLIIVLFILLLRMYILHKKNRYLFFYCLLFFVAWPGCYGMNSLFLEKLNSQNSLVSCFTFGFACFKINMRILALKKGQEMWNYVENLVKICWAFVI